MDTHERLQMLPLQTLQAVVHRYFHPIKAVEDAEGQVRQNLQMSPERTIAIYYRGTDKVREIELAPIEEYCAIVDEIDAKARTKLPILIQTDQAQALEKVLERFGPRARFIESLPVSRGTVGIHRLSLEGRSEFIGDRLATEFLAAVLFISKCAHVIATVSNVSAWIALYRGGLGNFYQFDRAARLIRP
jgi:hypothetical protein